LVANGHSESKTFQTALFFDENYVGLALIFKSMSDNTKSTDLGFLNSMTGGNKEKMAKYINMFLQHAPVLVNQLENNVQAQEWAALKTTAHTLKSQFSYMGAAEAQAISLAVEKNAGEKTNLEEIPKQVEKIRTIFNKACDELKEEVNRLTV